MKPNENNKQSDITKPLCNVCGKPAERFCYDGTYKAGEKKCKWFCVACRPFNLERIKRHD